MYCVLHGWKMWTLQAVLYTGSRLRQLVYAPSY
jgi:hypothetical protein